MIPLPLFIVILALLPFLIAATALFSAVETALFSFRPHEYEALRNRNRELADALTRLMENPRAVLNVILLSDALVNLPLILSLLMLFEHAFGPGLPLIGSCLGVLVVVVIVGDLVPKQLALADPERVSRIGVRILDYLMPVVAPLGRQLGKLADHLADALTPASIKPRHALTEEELSGLVKLSAEDGALLEAESEMIQEVIKLGNRTARDVMTPRTEIFAISDDLTDAELRPLLRTKRFRRVPVYGETPDDILGVLDVETYLLGSDLHYVEQLIPPSFISETMRARDLLHGFLSHQQGIAFVVDEHGGFEGIVTTADLVEEIISDALPDALRGLSIERLRHGQLLANGTTRVDDLSEYLEAPIPCPEGIDTIGGIIFNAYGTLPRPGTTVEFENLRFTVRRVARKRIQEVLIEFSEDATDAPASTDSSIG